MATIQKDYNSMGLPMNINRSNPIPVDNTELWYSLEEAQNYAQNDPRAYVGQSIKVINESTGDIALYVIGVDGSLLNQTNGASEHNHDDRYYTESEVDAEFDRLVGEHPVSIQISDALNDINEIINGSRLKLNTPIRMVLDTGLSKSVSKNGITFTRPNDYRKFVVDGTSTDITEFLLGSVKFNDCECGYTVMGIPEIDGVHVASRCGDFEQILYNNTIISKDTHASWESDFKDKIHELYLVISTGISISELEITGVIYENENMYDRIRKNSETINNLMYINKDNDELFDGFEFGAVSGTVNGIEFIVNDDNTITANGTATSDIVFNLGYNNTGTPSFDSNSGSYIVQGCKVPDGCCLAITKEDECYRIPTSNNVFEWNYTNNPVVEIEAGFFYTESFDIVLLIDSGTVLSNQLFDVSIRPAYPIDSAINDDRKNIDYAFSQLFKKTATYSIDNLLKIPETMLESDGITLTVDENGVVTIDGTASKDITFNLCNFTFENIEYGYVVTNYSDSAHIDGIFSKFDLHGLVINIPEGFTRYESGGTNGSLDFMIAASPVDLVISIANGTTISNKKIELGIYTCESIHDMVRGNAMAISDINSTLDTKVDKVDGSRLITEDEAKRLASLITGEGNQEVYVQIDEPTEAPNGAVWIDIDAAGGGFGLQSGSVPSATTDDNDKILQIVNGEYTLVTIENSSIKTYIDNYINEALGGDY